MKQLVGIMLLGSMIFGACMPEVPVPISRYNVPTSVQPHVEAFVKEGELRGKTINVENLVIKLGANLHQGAAATCHLGRNQLTPTIYIDTTSFNWRNNYYTREALVFHELGHIYLDRLAHRDDNMPNGDRASIMHTQCGQFFGGHLTQFKRTYYLDELFDETTPFPKWATDLPAYGDVAAEDRQLWFQESFQDNRHQWNVGEDMSHSRSIENDVYTLSSGSSAFLVSQHIPIDVSKDFEIEVKMKFASGDRSAMFQWGGSSKDDHYFWGFTREGMVLLGKKNNHWPSSLVENKRINALNVEDWNTFTIRKQATEYHFFINQTYFDVTSFEPFEGNNMGFYVGSYSVLEIGSLEIYYL